MEDLLKALHSEKALSYVPSTDRKINTERDICDTIPSLLQWPPIQHTNLFPITGGTTNKMFKLVHSLDSSVTVVVRIYGGSDVFTAENRNLETTIFKQLGDADISPRLVAVFSNGRVEQFVNGRPLVLKEMTEKYVCEGVARSLARLHSFTPTVPLSSIPSRLGAARKTSWSNIHDWISKIRYDNLTYDDINVEKCIQAVYITEEHIHSDDIVFCHNDVNAGNILVDNNNSNINENIKLIDYEYSDYNYRSYDIANFFLEAMGGADDGILHPSLYPNIHYRRQFCKKYLRELLGYNPSTTQVNELVEKAEQYGLLSHLYWGFWGLVQSKCSMIDFPYLKYARQRFDLFFHKCEWDFDD